MRPGGALNPAQVVPLASGAGKVLYDDGTRYQALAAGTSGHFLRSGGAGAPSWSALLATDLPATILGAPQALSGAGAANITTAITYLTASGAGQVVSLADGAYTGQKKRLLAAAGYNGTNTSVVTPANGPAVTLKTQRDYVEYEWGGAAWVICDLRLSQVSYEAAGRNGAGAVTVTGTKVGDRVVAVLGRNTSTEVWTALANGSFESVVSVADQIQQSDAANLSANTYVFLVEPRS